LGYSPVTFCRFVSAWVRLAQLSLSSAIRMTLARSLRSLRKGPQLENPRIRIVRAARRQDARFGNQSRINFAQRRQDAKIAAVARQVLRHWTLCAIFVSVIFVLAAPSQAQVSKEYQLKAVLLWRLAQFTQWPSNAFESADSPVVICVLGENPFGGALEAAVRGETAHGRRLAVQRHRSIDQIRDCHILFITGAGPRQAKEITAALAGRSVLTVADGDTLASTYEAMIQFVIEENKIKLRINPKAAAAARLVLDPRLLRSAEIIG